MHEPFTLDQSKYINPETQNQEEIIALATEPETYKTLLKYAIKICEDKTLAQDILHKSLVKFIEAVREKTFTSKEVNVIKSYLYKTIKNQFLDKIKKQKRWQTDQINPEGEEIFESGLPAPDEILREKYKQAALNNMLSKLSPKNREAMELYLQGYTEAEIKEQLNIPGDSNAVRFRINRSRKELFRLIN